MSAINTKTKKMSVIKEEYDGHTAEVPRTHGGAVAQDVNAFKELRRSLMTCMLWENNFYESGKEVANRIAMLVPQVNPLDVEKLTYEAKNDMKLRHAPLFVIRELARYTAGNLKKSKAAYKYAYMNVGTIVERVLTELIRRPDELAEFVAMYWKQKKQPLSAAVKRGLAAAFAKFDEYRLAKWDRNNDIKMRDVMFLVHTKPADCKAEKLYKKIADRELKTPDTWEVALSDGADKCDTFTRLIIEGKMGGMALLKNLRNMEDAGVDKDLVEERLANGCGKALPFDFMMAFKYAPTFKNGIEAAMVKTLEQIAVLPGRTLLVVDRSGSMYASLSDCGEKTRQDAAIALALLARSICEKSVIYATAGDDVFRKHTTKKMMSNGFKLIDEINHTDIGDGGIFLVQCLEAIEEQEKKSFDRVIVFTDEQDCDTKANPALAPRLGEHNYIVNIAANKNGIGYKNSWHHIDGWSERIFDYIREFEK